MGAEYSIRCRGWLVAGSSGGHLLSVLAVSAPARVDRVALPLGGRERGRDPCLARGVRKLGLPCKCGILRSGQNFVPHGSGLPPPARPAAKPPSPANLSTESGPGRGRDLVAQGSWEPSCRGARRHPPPQTAAHGRGLLSGDRPRPRADRPPLEPIERGGTWKRKAFEGRRYGLVPIALTVYADHHYVGRAVSGAAP